MLCSFACVDVAVYCVVPRKSGALFMAGDCGHGSYSARGMKARNASFHVAIGTVSDGQ